MDKQVNRITSGAFFHLRKVGKIRPFINTEAAKALVYAYITSKLDYCNSLLYGLPDFLISKLQYVQNTAARIITKTLKYDHITEVLAELHWLRVPQRHVFKIALLTFKCLNGLAPKYLVDLIQPYSPRQGLRSEKKNAQRIKVICLCQNQILKCMVIGHFAMQLQRFGTVFQKMYDSVSLFRDSRSC